MEQNEKILPKKENPQGGSRSPEGIESAAQHIERKIEELKAAPPALADSVDVSAIKKSIGLKNKKREEEIVSRNPIASFGENLKSIYKKTLTRLEQLKDFVGKGIRTGGLATVMTLTALQGTAQEVKNKEHHATATAATSAESDSTPNLGGEIEKVRTEQMELLKKNIADEKETLRVHDSKELFTESFKNKLIKESDNYLKALPNSIEDVKETIDTLTEDEVELLLRNIKDAPVNMERFKKEMMGKVPYDKVAEHIEEHIYEYTQQHRHVVHAFDNIQGWLESEGPVFIKHINEIDPADPKEEANKPSEIFKKAVDKVAKDHVLFAEKWLRGAISQEQIDTAWAGRPSAEFLKLHIQRMEEELANIDKNLHEAHVRKDIDSSRAGLMGYISSPKYLEKLITVEGMSEDSAKAMQAKRLAAVRDISFTLNPRYSATSQVEHTDHGPELTYSAYDIAHKPLANSAHELVHVALDGDANITPKERAIYESARISEQAFDTIQSTPLGKTSDLDAVSRFDPHPMDQFASATELAPRKYALEKEMDRLGIKKLFETMTHEHYLKLKQLMSEGKLNHNCTQIMLTTTEEGLLNIMNKIAFEDGKEKKAVSGASENETTSATV